MTYRLTFYDDTEYRGVVMDCELWADFVDKDGEKQWYMNFRTSVSATDFAKFLFSEFGNDGERAMEFAGGIDELMGFREYLLSAENEFNCGTSDLYNFEKKCRAIRAEFAERIGMVAKKYGLIVEKD